MLLSLKHHDAGNLIMQYFVYVIGFSTTTISFCGFFLPALHGSFPLEKFYDVLVLGLEPFPYSMTLFIAGGFTGLILMMLADISAALRGKRSIYDT